MTADDQPRRRFEPPPWEREAFERFEREQAERRAAEELEAALAVMRDQAEPSAAEDLGEEESRDRPAAVESPLTAEAPGPGRPAPDDGLAPAPPAPVPDARVEAMLVELRIEEPRVERADPVLINSIVAFLGLTGLFIVIQAGLLFARARAAEAAGLMLAATMSFLVLLVGMGFMVGAVLLFRKYHR